MSSMILLKNSVIYLKIVSQLDDIVTISDDEEHSNNEEKTCVS